MRRTWLALACAVLAGCGGSHHDRIEVGVPVAPVTLDPRYATDAMSARVVRLLHRPLVDFDAAARPVAALATWRMLDATRYRFTLDPTARFDDGRTVSAADVVATYHAVLDAHRGSPLRESLRNVARVTQVDARTVEFALHAPDALFPGVLGIGILAAEDAARERDAWRRGCGAFVRVAWHADGSVRLRRRSDGREFDLVVVKDASVRALKLVAGELDLIQGNLPAEIFDWLSTRPHLRAQRVPGTTVSYLGFNLERGGGERREVRAAIAHAIDREAIVASLFRGQARPAAFLLPPTHWAADPARAPPRFDPERARALLRHAGYGEHRLRLRLKTSADAFRLRIATVLAAQLAAVGIDVTIESLDWGTFYADVTAGRFDSYALSWVGLKLPDILRQAFHSSALPPAGANRGHYRSSELDRLIERAEAETGLARRAPLYHAVERRLLYDLPVIPLWFEDQTAVMRDDIAGYALDQDGSLDALAGLRVPSGHARH